MTTIKEHNVETGEVIEREMTAEEMAQFEADQLATETKLANESAKAAEKQALLERLGITQDEAKLLLS
jgi:hypothetical protein